MAHPDRPRRFPSAALALGIALAITAVSRAPLLAGSWPQFRGPNGAAVPDGDRKLPAEIGPEKNVIWKVTMPPGHSSPVVFGDRIYLTAMRGKALLTIGIDRPSGKILWERAAPYKQLERIHAIGSHAQSTPVTDGERVVSFFGSYGMLCYDPNGKLLWVIPMGPFKNVLGAGSSPIICGDRIILNQDHDLDSFLIAIDKRTGKTVWKTDRSEFPVGYASPVIWEVGGKKQVVVSGTLRIVGYDFDTGREVWTVRGMARAVHMTPTVGPDGILYAAAWTGGGDDTDRFDVPAFNAMLAKQDANKNGTLESNELPPGPLKDRFDLIDRDKDGHITRAEYEFMRRIFDTAHNRVVAIRPGGVGDITESHVVWSQKRYLPVIPSPLLYRGCLFLVQNGGIVCSLDARTGKPIKRERVPGVADYYSSPVAGDGKVYLFSQQGQMTVISGEPQWQVLARARFGEDIFATPAIVDGRIYVRTREHLYCFGLPDQP